MTQRCPECGQIVKTEREKLDSELFGWTATAVLLVGVVLSVAHWNLAWWTSRLELLMITSVPVIAAAALWWRWFKVRRQEKR